MMLHHHTKLVTKCSVVQKISSRNTFTNILNCCCDLKCSNPIFPQDSPTYDAVLQNQVWLQTDQQFRRESRSSHTLIIYEPLLRHYLHDTPAQDAALLYQVWYQNDLWFRRYHTKFDKIRHTEKISSRQTFTNVFNLCCDLDL